MPDIANLDELLPEELEAYRTLQEQWALARGTSRWVEADVLREQVRMWDALLGQDGLWHPQFEHNLNRQRRAYQRMRKYHTPVYPWDLSEL